MAKTKIECFDDNWNPITGCLHLCPYCYCLAMETAYRKTEQDGRGLNFLPAFHEDRLEAINHVKKGIVFAGSAGDMWGSWLLNNKLNEKFMYRVAIHANNYYTVKNGKAAIMFLTKNPAMYEKIIPIVTGTNKIWLGTTLDGGYKAKGWDEWLSPQGPPKHHDAPTVDDRLKIMHGLDYPRKWFSIEPFNAKVIDYYMVWFENGWLVDANIGWVVIGFETSKYDEPLYHEQKEVEAAFQLASTIQAKGIPVFVKDSIIDVAVEFNVKYPDDKPWPREFPSGLQLVTKSAGYHEEFINQNKRVKESDAEYKPLF